MRAARPDGEIRWVRSAASIVKNLYSVPNRAVGFIIDITEALRTDEHLKQIRTSLQREQTVLENMGKQLTNLAKELQR